MPNPITSSSGSQLSSPTSLESTDDCNPEVSSCAPVTSSTNETPRSVTIGPVSIAGESDSAARELVRRNDASPRCATEKSNAELTCLLAATSAGSTIAAAPSGIGFVMGLFTTAGLAAQCARDISSALDCKDQGQALADANADCSARGGTLLTGANSDLVCLVTR